MHLMSFDYRVFVFCFAFFVPSILSANGPTASQEGRAPPFKGRSPVGRLVAPPLPADLGIYAFSWGLGKLSNGGDQ